MSIRPTKMIVWLSLGLFFPQHPTKNLSDVRFGQFLPEFNVLGHFVTRKVFAGVSDDIFLLEGLVLLHDEDFDHLTRFLTGYTNSGDFKYARMAGQDVFYFVDDFPQRDQPHTSEDGLWVAMNVPEGSWNVEMYVSDGAGGHIQMSNTRVEVFANSINISNHYTGYGEGIKYPDSCVAAR